MILVSSLAAAGPSQSDRPRLETDPAQPVSNYGRSKRAGELAATSFADRIPLTIVRPPVVFGEGDLSMLSMVRPIKLLRLHLVPGFTERRASMIHAADLVAGLITAAERGERIVPGDNEGTARGFCFLADERSPTFAEWGQLIARSLGCRRLRVTTCAGTAGLGAGRIERGLGAGSPAAAYLQHRQASRGDSRLVGVRRGSGSRELGFSVAANLEARFAQTTRWYRSRGLI